MDAEQIRQLIETEKARPLQYLDRYFARVEERSTKGYRMPVATIREEIRAAATLFGITLEEDRP